MMMISNNLMISNCIFEPVSGIESMDEGSGLWSQEHCISVGQRIQTSASMIIALVLSTTD
jgi:hypothetical protein